MDSFNLSPERLTQQSPKSNDKRFKQKLNSIILPDLHVKFLNESFENINKTYVTSNEENETQDQDQKRLSKLAKAQRLSLLRSFIHESNGGSILSQVQSVQRIRKESKISNSVGGSLLGGLKSKLSKIKKRGPIVPSYLKEDFPNKTVQLARKEAKKMFEISEEATVQQFNDALDKVVYKNEAELRLKREKQFQKDQAKMDLKERLKYIREVNQKMTQDNEYKKLFTLGEIDLAQVKNRGLNDERSLLNFSNQNNSIGTIQ
ncbi:UNKNOWN [Stylonychia lemnae]|uniref:Uncharacterized protein n=1 Tax=Stylonychia lemnae TaxID=5949 RepID=A0A078ANW0_STYLE|nr:UNKNOWN [Stylonychia lemnae]|eukprot:CDW84045.1 UNKNOWN [Stylonychia lemnae]